MRYGITGNTSKEKLWQPVADLVVWLAREGIDFCMHETVAGGLIERRLVDEALCTSHTENDLAEASDVILSFGGDGTMLNSAHEVGERGTPILGVNIGRLGFLAEVEVADLQGAIRRLQTGEFRIEKRMTLSVAASDESPLEADWGLNEIVIERAGAAKMVSIDVTVDGVFLNNYWADGLLIATPTGSTAYSLSTGGPIMAPGCGAIILTPIAPHTLTVRPLVLPDSAVIEARVQTDRQPYVVSADGRSTLVEREGLHLTIRRARHEVNLVKLPEQHYFHTIRSKLMWGARPGNG